MPALQRRSKPKLTSVADVVTRRRKHYMRKRAYADALEADGLPEVAQRLRDCAETQVKAACWHCGKSWWVVDRCRLRVCPICAWKVAKERSAYIFALTKHMAYPKFVTLTMPLWTGDPKAGIKFLRESFSKLRRRDIWKRVRGGAYTIELKRKPNGWHIHLHCLLDSKYIPYRMLWAVWKDIIGAWCPQVDIRAASSANARSYITKDASKSAAFDTSPEHIAEWYRATKGLRLWGTFGKWFNATIQELGNELDLPDPPPPCPFCGSHGTTYLARDGPFIFGHEDWEKLECTIIDKEGYSRPIKAVKDALGADPRKTPTTQGILPCLN